MERIAAREPAALAALYDRHASLILALCVRILRDRSEAEEVLGDVFWEVWERHERYAPGRGAPVAYLLTLTRSRAVDRLRSRKARDARIVPVEEAESASEERSSVSVPPGDPLTDSLAAEQRRRVAAAVATLVEGQRRAIELSF